MFLGSDHTLYLHFGVPFLNFDHLFCFWLGLVVRVRIARIDVVGVLAASGGIEEIALALGVTGQSASETATYLVSKSVLREKKGD